MKNLLALIVFLPALIFGQSVNDLVIWNSPNVPANNYVKPNVILTYHVDADDVKKGTDVSLSFNNWSENNSSFQLKEISRSTTLAANSYIQFAIAPKAGHYLALNEFNFDHSLHDGTANYEVRYSKNSNFSNPIVAKTGNLNTQINNISVNLSNVTVAEGEKLYLRIYYYNLQSGWGVGSVGTFVRRSPNITHGNDFGPRFRGAVYQNNGLDVYQDIVRWDRVEPTVVNYIAATATNATGVTFETWGNHNQFLMIPSNSSQGIDLTKYAEFKVTAKEGQQLLPDYFNFNYRSQSGTAKMQVRAAKNPADFNNGNAVTLVNEISFSNTSSYTNSKTYFPSSINLILPGETLYVRIYIYGTYNNVHLEVNAPLMKGPRIAGNGASLDVCMQETIWNGNSWSNGEPTLYKRAKISGNYNTELHGNFKACTLIVDNGVTVKIGDGFNNQAYLMVRNEIIVNGELIVTNNANLVQINDNTNNQGNIIYQRNTNPMNRTGSTYWGAPVKINLNSTANNLNKITWKSEATPGNFDFTIDENLSGSNFHWNAELNAAGTAQKGWTFHSGEMIPAKGYIIKAPNSDRFPAVTTSAPKRRLQATFIGQPNNGKVVVPIVTNNLEGQFTKLQLISNPYPSAINLDQFLVDHNKEIELLDPAVYFWTHQTDPIQNVNGYYSYSNDDYAVYTQGGGVVVKKGAEKPKGHVASGQGFFVIAKPHPIAEVAFYNKYRYDGTEAQPVNLSNDNFYRNSTNVNTKSRIWLNITGDNGLFKQTLVGYIPGSSAEVDNYDGLAISSSNPVDIYTKIGAEKYSIQALGDNFSEEDTIAVGYKVTTPGTYTIEIDEVDGIFTSQDVYLKDNVTGSYHNLKDGVYTFVSEAGTFEDRFEIVFRVADDNLDREIIDINNNWVAFTSEGKINVQASGFAIKNIAIYDITGRQITAQNNINATSFTTENVSSKQVLIVKVTSTDNVTSTKKIQN